MSRNGADVEALPLVPQEHRNWRTLGLHLDSVSYRTSPTQSKIFFLLAPFLLLFTLFQINSFEIIFLKYKTETLMSFLDKIPLHLSVASDMGSLCFSLLKINTDHRLRPLSWTNDLSWCIFFFSYSIPSNWQKLPSLTSEPGLFFQKKNIKIS